MFEINNSVASNLAHVAIVAHICTKLFLGQRARVFHASREHTTPLPCSASAVRTLHKKYTKSVSERTCVSAATEFFCSCSFLELTQILSEVAALCFEIMETLEERIFILMLFLL